MKTKATEVTKQAFRYPGGKGKIAKEIINWLPYRLGCEYTDEPVTEYCEPFVGSGAILANVLPLLPKSCRIIVGDLDIGIVAFWRCIADKSKSVALCDAINKMQEPKPEMFYDLKDRDGSYNGDDVDAAFRKMLLHFISFSGIGAKAGGPIGGRKQRSDYNVTCRWKPERNIRNVTALNNKISKYAGIQVVHGDFKQSLSLLTSGGVAYIDPPYFVKGGQLYTHNMTIEDHARLAKTLKKARYDWVLSYDDHERIRNLYGEWADIHEFTMTATIDTRRGEKTRRKNNELVIVKRSQY